MQHVSRVRIASISAILLATIAVFTHPAAHAESALASFDLVEIERERILEKASAYLDEAPLTVTAQRAERSAGGLHDFYSEGDYWWPDPENPDGPYVRRDGISNPANFVAHRRAMVRLSEIVGTLTSAWIITRDEVYASHARGHLMAWFVDGPTRMTPSLLYGQAIKGRPRESVPRTHGSTGGSGPARRAAAARPATSARPRPGGRSDATSR